MADQERAPLRAIDHYVLEARAAHVYLDAVGLLKDAARRQVNIEKAREVLAELERALLEAAADDALRAQLQRLRDRLGERLNEFR